MQLSDFREEFEERYNKTLASRLADLERLLDDDELFSLVAQLKDIAAEGKRVRPYVLSALYHGAGGEDGSFALDMGVALESFHLFCLVHDDVMDRAEIRRGTKTVHTLAREQLDTDDRIGDAMHVANSQAILVGDLLFSWVNGWFCEVLAKHKTLTSAHAEIQRMMNEVMAGQMIDVDLMSRTKVDFERIERKMYLKTASYTFIRPMRLGAAMAGANGEIMAFCDDFGRALGLGFQIQDDLLDIVGTEGQIKKPTLSDLEEHQHTIFTQYVFERGTEKQKQTLEELFGQTLDSEAKDRARDLFESTGAIEYGEERMREFFNDAEGLLADAPVGSDARDDLSRLLAFIRNRRS